MSVNGPSNNQSAINMLNAMIKNADTNKDGKITGKELDSIAGMLAGAKEQLTAAEYDGVLQGWGIEHQAAPEANFDHVAKGDNEIVGKVEVENQDGDAVIGGNGNFIEDDGTTYAEGNNTIVGSVTVRGGKGNLVIGGNGNFIQEDDDKKADTPAAGAEKPVPKEQEPKTPPKADRPVQKPKPRSGPVPQEQKPKTPPKADKPVQKPKPMPKETTGPNDPSHSSEIGKIILDKIKPGKQKPKPQNPPSLGKITDKPVYGEIVDPGFIINKQQIK